MTLSRMHAVVEQPYHSDLHCAAVHAFLQLRDEALFHEIFTPESFCSKRMYMYLSESPGVH
jgi:hypothetical protein